MTDELTLCRGAIWNFLSDGKGDVVCPKRQRCRRYIAEPSKFGQVYMVPEKLGDDCEDFLPTTEGRRWKKP